MAKEKSKESSSKMLVGVVWSCADMKLLLSSLLFLCSLATLIQLFPSRSGQFYPSDLQSCLSKLSSPSPQPLLLPNSTNTTTITPNLSNFSSPSPPPETHQSYHPLKQEEIVAGAANVPVVKRAFNPIGAASYLFVQMGAYRGGLNNFAVIGLSSKPLHVYSKPQFQCEWVPTNATRGFGNITANGYKILPDWGYGRVYTAIIVNCTFPANVGTDGAGGRLFLRASNGGGGDRAVEVVEKIEALVEAAGDLNPRLFTDPPKYDYLYCGSSLYGNLSPQRVREWIAYHVKLFGPRSHFVIHDAGGVHPGVLEVLRPWMEKGYVTLQDIREQERFDGYYHNQFLVVNDCLHRYKFMSKWIFFFDVDEFIYVERKTTIDSLLSELSGYTQFTIEQMPMSSKLCLSRDFGRHLRMWGFEKLVYRDVKHVLRRDRKYAIQPRNAFATGVHMSQNVAGKTLHKTERRIKYFHYHGTIANRREPCREFVNATTLTYEDTPYVLDNTFRGLAGTIKIFERKTIGRRLQRTRQ